MSGSLFFRYAMRALLVAGVTVAPGVAGAVVIAPGQSLDVTFSFPSAPSPSASEVAALGAGNPLLVADVLDVFLALQPSGMSGTPLAEVQLFNGQTLLYSTDISATGSTSIAFVGPGSPYSINSAELGAGFASIADGSIQGLIRVTNISTKFAGDLEPAPTYAVTVGSIVVGRAQGPEDFSVFSPSPVIGSETLVDVAEPGALGLFALGLGGVMLIRRGGPVAAGA